MNNKLTETSTLLPKCATPTASSSILATILEEGYKCLRSAKPNDDTISSTIQDWQEVTKATQELASPRDEIKSQLTKALYSHYSEVPRSYYLNTGSMPVKDPLTIPAKEGIKLKDYFSFLDRHSHSQSHQSQAEPRTRSLMNQYHEIEHEVLCRGFSRLGCLSHISDMRNVGLDWKLCSNLLNNAIEIANRVANDSSRSEIE